jgi:excisionase family DNA binding protein
MAVEERWVGVEDVAAHLGVSRDSVYRWIETRDLPARRVGRLLRFKLSEIDDWVCRDNEKDGIRTSIQGPKSSK